MLPGIEYDRANCRGTRVPVLPGIAAVTIHDYQHDGSNGFALAISFHPTLLSCTARSFYLRFIAQ
jgi:hypothetical protein